MAFVGLRFPSIAAPGGIGSSLVQQLGLGYLAPQPRGMVGTWFDGVAYALGISDSFSPDDSFMEGTKGVGIGINSFNPIGLGLDGVGYTDIFSSNSKIYRHCKERHMGRGCCCLFPRKIINSFTIEF